MPQRSRRGIRTKEMLNIARERIDILFSLAEKVSAGGNAARASRYASLAAKIGTRYNVRLPSEHKMRFCRGCGSYLAPGKNSRVRLNDGKRLVRCMGCGRDYRYPYRQKKRQASGAKP